MRATLFFFACLTLGAMSSLPAQGQAPDGEPAGEAPPADDPAPGEGAVAPPGREAPTAPPREQRPPAEDDTPASEPPSGRAPGEEPGAEGSAGSAPADSLTPPKLVVFEPPAYPEQALAEGREVSVTVMLVIGTDGRVESASLVGDPVGQGFDEAALEAAKKLGFEPARKGGEAMRARLGFRFQFAPPPPPPEEGELEITVIDADEDRPLAGVEVLLATPRDPSFGMRLVTDAQGQARSDRLPSGDYELILRAPSHLEQTHQETVVTGEVSALRYRMASRAEETDAYGFGATARAKAPPREVTRRTIEREELTRIPGTRGDALRTIELLPGVSRPPLGAGFVLIRGAAPGDSQVLLDGVPVPILYHFGGLTSFINSRALDRIDFYPGNFSTRYGRNTGGIIDVGVRDPARDRVHAVIDANVPLDSSVLVEGPINDQLGFMVGARRSYFGEVLTAVVPDGTFSAFAAPVYWDYQAFVTYKPSERDSVRVGSYGASDALDVLFADAPDEAPEIRAIEVGLKFHRAQVGWSHNYSSALEHDIQVSYGRIDQDFYLGPDLSFDLGVNQLYARAEWRYRISDRLQAIAGFDGHADDALVKYRGPQATQQEGDSTQANPLSSREVIDVRDSRVRYFPALYTELAIRATDKLRLVPGMRVDYFEEIEAFAFDPRLSGMYSLTDQLRLKAGVGLFSQAPAPQESSPTAIGNPRVDPIQSVHTSAGVEHDLAGDFSVGVEGFYKYLYDRVVTNQEPGGPPFINDGVGRIYGLEVSGRKNASGKWFGFLSYTLMRSERNDRGEGYRLFDFDQTHLFTTALVRRFGRGWELGATVRIYSGNPQTPVAGSQFDLGTRQYSPVLGAYNSARAPTFHRVDVRAEKQWRFDGWKLAWYLDIQNVYNAENPEGRQYSYDFRESAAIRGLPIIPILGLRAEL